MIFLGGNFSGFSQSVLRISSPDSTLFDLKVNTILVTDSMVMDLELEFAGGHLVNFQFSDSIGTILLDEDVSIIQNTHRDYSFQFFQNTWSLLLVSESERLFTPENIRTSIETSSLAEVSEQESILPIKITSTYKSESAPNREDISALDEIVFEKERVKAIKKLLRENQLTDKEIIKVLNKISFEDQRAAIIDEFSEQLSSKLDHSSVSDLFKLNKYETQALEALGL